MLFNKSSSRKLQAISPNWFIPHTVSSRYQRHIINPKYAQDDLRATNPTKPNSNDFRSHSLEDSRTRLRSVEKVDETPNSGSSERVSDFGIIIKIEPSGPLSHTSCGVGASRECQQEMCVMQEVVKSAIRPTSLFLPPRRANSGRFVFSRQICPLSRSIFCEQR
ncbi:hypothetical protein CDAR_559191 [Caerostris darwini]|uniref:Uncharacterized protein n=1 Tax=Caerostris darwini TaxID=1538125 RepID=A0AAV4NZJ3_9ARAC|nr:hypothetical protein CDAR_559191 [Caerostris darwini]